MVNKQGLWFLTLTSLALVLSVYYITMPNELLLTNNTSYLDKETNEEVVSSDGVGDTIITESELITSMRVELEQERLLLLDELQDKLTNSNLTVDEKNEVYEDLRYISEISTREETLERKIKDEFKLDSFIKISDDVVDVVISSTNHDKSLAVNIMKSLQEEFETKMYISVSFKE
ncbi:MAG: SpoIIIAH-like family protein [Bacilli bacterium]|nr:SpoIIIAH-like family protein [Bacilli bacterium]